MMRRLGPFARLCTGALAAPVCVAAQTFEGRVLGASGEGPVATAPGGAVLLYTEAWLR